MNALDSPILKVPSQSGLLGLCLPEVLSLISIYPDCIESHFAQQPEELRGNCIAKVIQWTQLCTWSFPRDQTWGPHKDHQVTSVHLLTYFAACPIPEFVCFTQENQPGEGGKSWAGCWETECKTVFCHQQIVGREQVLQLLWNSAPTLHLEESG